ncbi:hypothetical protein ABZ920_19085 [Streptomyces sp. NPDC046831]|uniref:hypothetical protein n=1 Tax=Streptomyces sp. NPDC046831 TaxID=3154805 RepID=UPI0033FCF19A
METGAAIFTGAVFALFGAALLGWTVVRVRHGRPVALGVNRTASATLAGLAAVAALTAGAWCFTRL